MIVVIIVDGDGDGDDGSTASPLSSILTVNKSVKNLHPRTRPNKKFKVRDARASV
jgi:hypothetical protein